MKKRHLTEGQRHELFALLGAGKNRTEIAQALGFHKCTICREIRRNADGRNGEYRPELAQRKYERRMSSRKHSRRFSGELPLTVSILLGKDYSPEQITDFLRDRGQEKARFGDLEIDTVIGKNHKELLFTINDRMTGLVGIRLLSGNEAASLTEAAIEALSPVKDLIHTITADNGKEFRFHERMAERLGVLVFFAKPYHSWERGANENTNGLIRQYFPKGTDFAAITPGKVQWVQDRLNARPRKRLGYLSPKEKFKQLTSLDYSAVALSA